jgi:RNA 2',3'-cyclic 3'-phosphodiesterase
MGGMETMRAFIAVELPANVREYLGAVTADLAAQIKRGAVRWVTPERMHLTLRFLGNTAVSQLPALYEAIDDVATPQRPFQLQLTELGAFPNQQRPRVILVGLGGETAELTSLKQQLDQALASLGWPVEDRPFRPHLTLGRVKDSRVGQQIKWQARVGQLVIPVTAMHLVESQLRRDGPVYTTRHSSHFYTPER